MTMCLPLSDFVLTSRGDRQHISSNLHLRELFCTCDCARSLSRTQLCTHEMTKEPRIKILCPQNQLLHLFTPCLCVRVSNRLPCVTDFTESFSFMC